MDKDILLIQAPFVQLNSPYPAPYYLKTFLEKRGYTVRIQDHSIGLFEKIFCKDGLKKVFADAEFKADKTAHTMVERFFSEEAKWIATINRLVAFLRGKDREFGHLLALANGVLPSGPRFDACMERFGNQPASDDSPLLASALLADIADFITVTLDPNFSLIHYTPRAPTGFHDFSLVEQHLNTYIMEQFYQPFLRETWRYDTAPLIVGFTIPFPGCLIATLVCAAAAKAHFCGKITTIAGGGYVNTELRFLKAAAFFDYIDYVAFDKGYGSLAAILSMLDEGKIARPPLYKTAYRSEAGIVNRSADEKDSPFALLEDDAVKTIFPDYTGVDFSRYLCPVDDSNPMHRLWSDGRWLKAYAAYGCYWHACAFCDVHLDYIRSFTPVAVDALFSHLLKQAEKTGVSAVHLVDEAVPVFAFVRLAELNRSAGLPLLFWGNIRFDRGWTPDAAALLAEGGVLGVSGGIEVASEAGFKRIGKGITLSDVVRSTAAFKEQGILTHAYLIYGYWDEDEQELVDSVEIMRQLFAAGLLDSAFWHKFVLTRHSRIYGERGAHKGLRGVQHADGDFALNDLSFTGEERFDRWTKPLDRLMASWMAGDYDTPVASAFPFKVPPTQMSPETVAVLVDDYARTRDEATPPHSGNVIFLGSKPMVEKIRKGALLFWRWRLADRFLLAGGRASAVRKLLEQARCAFGIAAPLFYHELEELFGAETQKVWWTLRNSGLALTDFDAPPAPPSRLTTHAP